VPLHVGSRDLSSARLTEVARSEIREFASVPLKSRSQRTGSAARAKDLCKYPRRRSAESRINARVVVLAHAMYRKEEETWTIYRAMDRE
jgi:hypothetical protein